MPARTNQPNERGLMGGPALGGSLAGAVEPVGSPITPRSVYGRADDAPPPLFAPPPAARHDHPATSHAAAASVAPITGQQRQAVFEAIAAAAYGLTDEEGITATGISASAYRPRRVELVGAGVVKDSGQTRKTVSGRSAIVWRVAEVNIAAGEGLKPRVLTTGPSTTRRGSIQAAAGFACLAFCAGLGIGISLSSSGPAANAVGPLSTSSNGLDTAPAGRLLAKDIRAESGREGAWGACTHHAETPAATQPGNAGFDSSPCDLSGAAGRRSPAIGDGQRRGVSVGAATKRQAGSRAWMPHPPVEAALDARYAGEPAMGKTGGPDRLLRAIIQVESAGRSDAVGDGGKAVGILQIHACVIADVNDWLGEERYALADRLDPSKTREIFTHYIARWCPNGTDEQKSRVWNGGPRGASKPATAGYWERVRKAMEAQ